LWGVSRSKTPLGAQTESLCSGAKQNFGPAGFEPTTCRRGDRSQIQHGKFVAASPRLEIQLPSHGFGSSREAFLLHEKPWDSVARGLGVTGIMPTYPIVEVLT